MMERLYFVAGLPRSGSTLLCNLLMQNPRFYASGTSGLVEVVRGVRDGWDTVAAHRAMPAPVSRQAEAGALRGLLFGYHAGVGRPVAFDKNRAWPAYLETLTAVLDPHPLPASPGSREGQSVRILACVRDVRDVLASLELRWRATAAWGLTTQERTEPGAFGSLEQRCALWARADQPLGSAYNVLKGAVQRGHGDKIHYVRFEELTAHPTATMAGVYGFLGEEAFDHDFERVEQVIQEDDRAHGFVGLHEIRSAVRPVAPRWPDVLGPVADGYKGQEFW